MTLLVGSDRMHTNRLPPIASTMEIWLIHVLPRGHISKPNKRARKSETMSTAEGQIAFSEDNVAPPKMMRAPFHLRQCDHA